MSDTSSRPSIFVVVPARQAAAYQWDAPRAYREVWGEYLFWLFNYDCLAAAVADRQQADAIVATHIGDAALLLSAEQSIITPVFVRYRGEEYEVYADVRGGSPLFRVYDSAGRQEGSGTTIRQAFARLRPRTWISSLKRQWELHQWRRRWEDHR